MLKNEHNKILKHPALQFDGRFKYYHLLVSAYIAILITTSIMGLTFTNIIVPFTTFQLPAGTGMFFFPTIFLIDDIVTEVYGYAAARQMMWIGMAVYTFLFLSVMLSMHMPIYQKWQTAGHDYDHVFSFMPRVYASFMVGILVGAIVNDYAMAKIKIQLNGRFFMLRSIGSSMIGELALQISGASVGLIGRFNYIHEILPMIAFAYSYKIIFDLVGMLIAYPLQKILKKSENIDHYDIKTNFNPFRFKIQ